MISKNDHLGNWRGFEFPVCWSERIEGCHDAAFLVWNACQSKAHFNSAERSGQHQSVKTAEVPDAKYFSREFREACTKGHVKILEDDCSQPVRVVTFGHKNSSQ